MQLVETVCRIPLDGQGKCFEYKEKIILQPCKSIKLLPDS